MINERKALLDMTCGALDRLKFDLASITTNDPKCLSADSFYIIDETILDLKELLNGLSHLHTELYNDIKED